MTLGESVRTELVGASEVTALVAERVHPSVMPQGSALPAVVFSIISDVPENSFTSAASATQSIISVARLQVDCYAKTYIKAHEVAAAVDLVLSNLAGPTPKLSAWRENLRDLYDNETQLHRVSLEFSVWHG